MATKKGNGKLLQMMEWTREDIKEFRTHTSKNFDIVFKKIDKIEEQVTKNSSSINSCKTDISGLKQERKDDRKEFLVKAGIFVSVIGIVVSAVVSTLLK